MRWRSDDVGEKISEGEIRRGRRRGSGLSGLRWRRILNVFNYWEPDIGERRVRGGNRWETVIAVVIVVDIVASFTRVGLIGMYGGRAPCFDKVNVLFLTHTVINDGFHKKVCMYLTIT